MKSIFAAALALVLSSLPALAQQPRAFSWTGLYAGLHAGWGWSNDTSAALSGDANIVQPIINGTLLPPPFIPSSLDPNPSGFIGGVQAGYNWQSGSVVIGFEADISHSSLDDGDTTSLIFGALPVPPSTSLDTDIEWFSTVRGRVGFLPLRGLMLFATSGLAFGETEQTLRFVNNSVVTDIISANGSDYVCPPGSCLAGSNSETSVGWAAGGGFEFAVSEFVTLKGEYLYVDLGSSTVTARGNATNGNTTTTPDVFLRAKVENTLNVIRAGLNVKLY